jgi:hypothetical protein
VKGAVELAKDNHEYNDLLMQLLPQVEFGKLAFVIQDSKVIQINVEAKNHEINEDYSSMCQAVRM